MNGLVTGTSSEANVSKLMRGWIVGHMHSDTELRGTSEFEIKLWEYDGPIDYGKKSFAGTELVVIYGGILRFELEREVDGNIEKDEIQIFGEKKEYIIFPPGITKTVVVVESPAFGITVRWPSGPGVNKIVK